MLISPAYAQAAAGGGGADFSLCKSRSVQNRIRRKSYQGAKAQKKDTHLARIAGLSLVSKTLNRQLVFHLIEHPMEGI